MKKQTFITDVVKFELITTVGQHVKAWQTDLVYDIDKLHRTSGTRYIWTCRETGTCLFEPQDYNTYKVFNHDIVYIIDTKQKVLLKCNNIHDALLTSTITNLKKVKK